MEVKYQSNRMQAGALIAGIVFFVFGIGLMMKGIAAEGSIDIQSALVSGKITTGSAGLFVLFFAFLIITVSLKSREAPAGQGSDRQHVAAQRTFFALLAALVVCIVGAALAPKESRTAFFLFGGYLVAMLFRAMDRYLGTP